MVPNLPIKATSCLTEWIKKQIPSSCCLHKHTLVLKIGTTLKQKDGKKKVFQSNGTRKQAGVTVLLFDKSILSLWFKKKWATN